MKKMLYFFAWSILVSYRYGGFFPIFIYLFSRLPTSLKGRPSLFISTTISNRNPAVLIIRTRSIQHPPHSYIYSTHHVLSSVLLCVPACLSQFTNSQAPNIRHTFLCCFCSAHKPQLLNLRKSKVRLDLVFYLCAEPQSLQSVFGASTLRGCTLQYTFSKSNRSLAE